MANKKASEKVSPAFNDTGDVVTHPAKMARKVSGQRWFLKQWRLHRRLTQDQLAERAGLSKPYISQLENGTRQYTQETLERLAAALQADPASLIMRNPADPEGMWTIYDQLTVPERRQGLTILTALKNARR